MMIKLSMITSYWTFYSNKSQFLIQTLQSSFLTLGYKTHLSNITADGCGPEWINATLSDGYFYTCKYELILRKQS